MRLVKLGIIIVLGCIAGLAAHNYSTRAPVVHTNTTEINLGDVPFGDIQQQPVRITNIGSAKLDIDYIGSSCGCATLLLPRHTLPPGYYADLTIEVAPNRGSVGANAQTLSIRTNDPAQPILQLTAKWNTISLSNVELSIDEIERDVPLADIKHSTGYSRASVFIMDRRRGELELNDLETSQYLDADVVDLYYGCADDVTDCIPSRVLRLDLQLHANLAPGTFKEWVQFSTNDPNYSTVTIPFHGDIINHGQE